MTWQAKIAANSNTEQQQARQSYRVLAYRCYRACETISAYTSSGIFLIMPIVTLLTRSAFSWGNDRSTLLGLLQGQQKVHKHGKASLTEPLPGRLKDLRPHNGKLGHYANNIQVRSIGK